jgi:hypothetical protein
MKITIEERKETKFTFFQAILAKAILAKSKIWFFSLPTIAHPFQNLKFGFLPPIIHPSFPKS